MLELESDEEMRELAKEELAELEREATIADYRDFYESVVMIANDMASVDVTCPDEEMIQKCRWVAAIMVAINNVPYGRANHILEYRGISFLYNQFVKNNFLPILYHLNYKLFRFQPSFLLLI